MYEFLSQTYEDIEAIYERLLPMIVAVAARLPFPADEGVPRRTSSLTGAQDIEELFLQPHERDFQEALRMPYHTFMALEAWLCANTTPASSEARNISIFCRESIVQPGFAGSLSTFRRDDQPHIQ